MPARVTDPTPWCLSTAGLCWARQDSVDLIGNSGQRPSLAVGRRGRELNGSPIAPGSFSWPAAESQHNLGTKMIGRLRPQDKSAKNWSPDPIGAAVITFEWLVQGGTAKSFWVARWRLITALENRLWCQRPGPIALTGSIEPE